MSTIGGVSGGQPYTPPSFSQLDQNSDGGISLTEFETDAPGGASGSDASSAAQQSRAEALFNQIDTNGDGSISSDELNSFESQASQQSAAQNFLTQLIASGQSGTSGAGSSGHAHGHHHHGGGGGGGDIASLGDTSSTDGTDTTGDTSTDGSSTSTDPLTMLENMLDGATSDSSSSSGLLANPADLLAANSAYGSSTSSTSNLWSSFDSVLQNAA